MASTSPPFPWPKDRAQPPKPGVQGVQHTQKLPAELTFRQEMHHRAEFAEEALKWRHLEWDF